MPQSAVFVAIGANLPTTAGRAPRATCLAAVEALRGLAGLRLMAVSRWYRTAAIPAGAPDYINGVAWLDGEAEPAALLGRLQAIETQAGRVRPYPNAPRVLDLDILAIGGLMRAAPDPVLPHPRLHLRRFVLQPLADVAPGWIHPILLKSAVALLEGVRDQSVSLA